MKCCKCKKETQKTIFTIWRKGNNCNAKFMFYCEACITLGKIGGQLKRNPITGREQWYEKWK